MVITPKQVRETKSKQDRLQIKRLEEQIDEALKAGEMTITLIGGLNPRIKDKLVTKYEQAGWQVNYQHNQTDKGYLFFNEQRRPIGFFYDGK